jgi:hypothetical protein
MEYDCVEVIFISSRPKVGIITYGTRLHNCSQDVE